MGDIHDPKPPDRWTHKYTHIHTHDWKNNARRLRQQTRRGEKNGSIRKIINGNEPKERPEQQIVFMKNSCHRNDIFLGPFFFPRSLVNPRCNAASTAVHTSESFFEKSLLGEWEKHWYKNQSSFHSGISFHKFHFMLLGSAVQEYSLYMVVFYYFRSSSWIVTSYDRIFFEGLYDYFKKTARKNGRNHLSIRPQCCRLKTGWKMLNKKPPEIQYLRG